MAAMHTLADLRGPTQKVYFLFKQSLAVLSGILLPGLDLEIEAA